MPGWVFCYCSSSPVITHGSVMANWSRLQKNRPIRNCRKYRSLLSAALASPPPSNLTPRILAARSVDNSLIIGFSASWSLFSRDYPRLELPSARLTSRACPRRKITDKFSGPLRRLLAHYRLFRLVTSLLSRLPATGAAWRAPCRPRLPAQSRAYSRRKKNCAAGPAPRMRPGKDRPELRLHRPPPDQRPGRALSENRLELRSHRPPPGQLPGRAFSGGRSERACGALGKAAHKGRSFFWW